MPVSAWGDTYPSKPVRIVVPQPSGGPSDVMARLVALKLAEALKQPVVVDNRPGANGIIGTDVVAKAVPNGYTLLMTPASSLTLVPHLYKLPYDSIKDLAPVSLVSNTGTLFMFVNSSVPAKTIQEFIALAKSKPGQINFGAGTSATHLAGEMFRLATGADITAIPYKGTGPQLTALLAGEVSMAVDGFPALPYVKSGKLRALAALSPNRSPVVPDVPTMRESGVQGVEIGSWTGLLAPAGTPKEIINQLQVEIAKIVALPDVKQRLVTLGAEPVGNTPEQFTAIIDAENATWAKVVKATGFKVDQ
ncbi:MAG: tripartite tricarboxylate transporter substrate binding protein [Betaproteobacteria bacterium]|nr:MAG: tripartite tricarboxylate transporter substrate binding protein [Betaproteobacteria bacterium]